MKLFHPFLWLFGLLPALSFAQQSAPLKIRDFTALPIQGSGAAASDTTLYTLEFKASRPALVDSVFFMAGATANSHNGFFLALDVDSTSAGVNAHLGGTAHPFNQYTLRLPVRIPNTQLAQGRVFSLWVRPTYTSVRIQKSTN